MLFSAVSDEIEIFSKWRCISSIVCVHSTIFIEQDLGSCIHIYDEFLNRLAFAGTATPAYHFFFFGPSKSLPVPDRETIVRRYVFANKPRTFSICRDKFSNGGQNTYSRQSIFNNYFILRWYVRKYETIIFCG